MDPFILTMILLILMIKQRMRIFQILGVIICYHLSRYAQESGIDPPSSNHQRAYMLQENGYQIDARSRQSSEDSEQTFMKSQEHSQCLNATDTRPLETYSSSPHSWSGDAEDQLQSRQSSEDSEQTFMKSQEHSQCLNATDTRPLETYSSSPHSWSGDAEDQLQSRQSSEDSEQTFIKSQEHSQCLNATDARPLETYSSSPHSWSGDAEDQLQSRQSSEDSEQTFMKSQEHSQCLNATDAEPSKTYNSEQKSSDSNNSMIRSLSMPNNELSDDTSFAGDGQPAIARELPEESPQDLTLVAVSVMLKENKEHKTNVKGQSPVSSNVQGDVSPEHEMPPNSCDDASNQDQSEAEYLAMCAQPFHPDHGKLDNNMMSIEEPLTGASSASTEGSSSATTEGASSATTGVAEATDSTCVLLPEVENAEHKLEDETVQKEAHERKPTEEMDNNIGSSTNVKRKI